MRCNKILAMVEMPNNKQTEELTKTRLTNDVSKIDLIHAKWMVKKKKYFSFKQFLKDFFFLDTNEVGLVTGFCHSDYAFAGKLLCVLAKNNILSPVNTYNPASFYCHEDGDYWVWEIENKKLYIRRGIISYAHREFWGSEVC